MIAEKVTSIDMLYERMREDYENGLFDNPSYEPFFAVKFYGVSSKLLTKTVCNHILNETQRELMMLEEKHPFGHLQIMRPWFSDITKPYKGYGEDCMKYAYLVEIEHQMVKRLF